MAQEVGYHEDNVAYEQGPFVIVHCNGWRIEVEFKGHHCPVLPDSSIYKITEVLGLPGKTNDKALAAAVCDTLNQMVADKLIQLAGKVWVGTCAITEVAGYALRCGLMRRNNAQKVNNEE